MHILTQDETSIYIDNNILSWWRQCQKKAYYQATLGLSLGDTNPALYFGSKWHEAMAVLWGSSSDTDIWNIEKTLTVLEDYSPRLEDPVKGRTRERMENALREYHEYVNEASGENYRDTALAASTLMAEEFIKHPIMDYKGKTVYYCGVVDRVFALDERILILDYKTTTWNRITDNTWNKNPQFMGYLWLLNKVAPSLYTNHFILDLFMLQAKTNNRFVRRYLEYEDWQLSQWEADRKSEIIELLSSTHQSHRPNCDDYGGCIFNTLCDQPEECLEGLKQFYLIEPWNMHGNTPITKGV